MVRLSVGRPVAVYMGPWLPLCPLPEQQVVAVTPGSGGAGRAAAVPGGAPGAVRAAAAITLGVEEEFVLNSDGAHSAQRPSSLRASAAAPVGLPQSGHRAE